MNHGLDSVPALGFKVALFSRVHGSLCGIEAQAEAGFATGFDCPAVLRVRFEGGEAF